MPAEEAKRAIAPGSIPYGDRGVMEQAIGTANSTPEAQAAPAMGLNPINSQDPYSSPMGALLGRGGFTSSRPITSGLSVGPGEMPTPDLSGLPVPLMQKLQDAALHAKSPQLRGAALLALRRIVRNSKRR